MRCADPLPGRACRPALLPRLRRRPPSLAARLTAWFVGCSFALVVIVIGSLYWALVNGLVQADDETLLNKVHVLDSLLAARQPDQTVIAQEIGEDANAPRRVYVRVLSPSGIVLRETPGMAASLPRHLFDAGHFTPDKAGRGWGTRHGTDGRPFRVLRLAGLRAAGFASGGPVSIEAAVDTVADRRLLARYRTDLFVALGAALLVCAAAGYQIVRAGLRPLRRIARAAETIGAATLDSRLDEAGLPTELRGLAVTINAMLGRLQDSFSRLRQFSDDIAHELRTPINRLLVASEVALDQAQTVDECREVLASNIDACSRLSQMIQGLLFLARSENPGSRILREPVDLARELATIRDFYAPLAGEGGIALALACDDKLTGELDRSLLQRAVGNLVANAVAHTPPGGSISIRGADRDRDLSIEVADTGRGIAAEHLPHVFDRFYRADQQRPVSGGNLGLGLSIVRSIAGLHGGAVEISSTPGKGTTVRMLLPRHAAARAQDDGVVN